MVERNGWGKNSILCLLRLDDWTKPHRSNVNAAVQAAVSQVLRKRGIKGEQFAFLRHRLMQQAEATYGDWPLVA